jgi:uncharacterized membrane protein
MTDTTVRVSLPKDGRIVTIDLDDTVTVGELIDELLASGRIPRSSEGYRLRNKEGEILDRHRKIRDLGLIDNDVLGIIPATDGPTARPLAEGTSKPWPASSLLAISVVVLLTIGSGLLVFENQTYQQARGDMIRLNAYLHKCFICIYGQQAEQEVNSIRESMSAPSAAGVRQDRNEEQTISSAQQSQGSPQPEASPLFQFEVCNTGCTPASVAVSYYSSENSAWVTRGWWTVPGNKCVSFGSFAKGQFYYYAKGFYSDAVEWRGDFGLCVKFPGPFLTTNRGQQCSPREFRRFIGQNILANNYRWSIQSFCE